MALKKKSNIFKKVGSFISKATKGLPAQTASVNKATQPFKSSLSAPKPLGGLSSGKTPVPVSSGKFIGPVQVKPTQPGQKGFIGPVKTPFQGPALDPGTGKSLIKPTGSGTSNKNNTGTSADTTAFSSPLSLNRTSESSQGTQIGTNNVTTGLGAVTGGLTNVDSSLLKNIPDPLFPEKTQTEIPPVTPPAITPEQQKADEAKKETDTALQDYLKTLGDVPSSAEAYKKAQQESGILQRQQEVNDLTGQLNAIVNKGQANKLALIGQGRGIPEVIIGGQQAQIDRETAIQALPVQAQLDAAQGNLEMANENLDTLFKIYAEDARNEFEYKRDVKKMLYEYASASEKRALEVADKVEQRKYQETLDLNKERGDYAKMAFANGQSILGAKIAKLNPKSPTFKEDLAELTAKLKDPVQTAQLAKLNAEIAQLNNKGATINGVNEDLTAYATQYADTGKLPSPAELKLSGLTVGQVTTMAKQIPRAEGFIVSNVTGTKSNSVSAPVQEDFQRLYNITKLTNELAELDKKRVGGLISGAAGKLFGSQDQAAYLTTRKAVVDELSRMQSGAALTQEEVAFYEDYLPGRTSETFFLGQDSSKKIQNFNNVMNTKLQNGLANNGLSIYGYSKVKIPGDIVPFRTVGDIIDIKGVNYRVLPDGTLTDIL